MRDRFSCWLKKLFQMVGPRRKLVVYKMMLYNKSYFGKILFYVGDLPREIYEGKFINISESF